MSKVILLSIVLAVAFADDCTVTKYQDIDNAVKSCSKIVINNLEVPGGETLQLDLKSGTTLTFQGTTKFGVYNWKGPLLNITGNALTVNGASGSVLDAQGPQYWDGKGSSGVKKPKFFRIEATGGSVFNNIKLKNCAVHCVSIGNSEHLTLDGWTIDVSAGDENALGHNTDGFDISMSSYILIQNTNVYNQDDCIAVNSGTHMTFSNMLCSGGHGMSLSVGQTKNDGVENTVEDINFLNSKVVNSANAIHIKTHTDAGTGLVKDVTYKDIEFENAMKYGINIQEDYKGGSSSGKPKNNIPIQNLVFDNVHGTVNAKGVGVYILCADDGGCSQWNWSKVDVTGQKKNDCNFTPNGYSC